MTNKPFIRTYREFWANAQSVIFYPFQSIGPFVVAAMPALFVGHSVYTWYADNSAPWVALLIAVVVAVALEAININIVHTALNLFEQHQRSRGFLMAFLSVVVMSIVSSVIGFSETNLSPLVKGLSVASPWLTGIVYLAVGMGQSINEDRQQTQIDKALVIDEAKEQKAFDREQERGQVNFTQETERLKDANIHELKMAKLASKAVPDVSQPTVPKVSQGKTLETLKPDILAELGQEKPNMTQLSSYLGIGRSALYRHLGTLVETGEVVKNGDGYELPPTNGAA